LLFGLEKKLQKGLVRRVTNREEKIIKFVKKHKKFFEKIAEKYEVNKYRCPICGKKFKRVDKYLYEPICNCIKKKIRLAVVRK